MEQESIKVNFEENVKGLNEKFFFYTTGCHYKVKKSRFCPTIYSLLDGD